MITDSGIIIRTPASEISTYSRAASGVIVMRLLEGQTIANITKVAREEDAEEAFDGENVDGQPEAETEDNAPVEE